MHLQHRGSLAATQPNSGSSCSSLKSLGRSPRAVAGLRSRRSTAALNAASKLDEHTARGFGQYIRKKQLDPLETYIPLVLEAKIQLRDAGSAMDMDVPLAKKLLREGAFSGLRDNIRSIGEYAEAEGKAADARLQVVGFFRTLEAFDLLLATSIRSGTALDLVAARSALEETDAALDRVIALVPEDLVRKGQQVLDVILEKSNGTLDNIPEVSMSEL